MSALSPAGLAMVMAVREHLRARGVERSFHFHELEPVALAGALDSLGLLARRGEAFAAAVADTRDTDHPDGAPL